MCHITLITTETSSQKQKIKDVWPSRALNKMIRTETVKEIIILSIFFFNLILFSVCFIMSSGYTFQKISLLVIHCSKKCYFQLIFNSKSFSTIFLKKYKSFQLQPRLKQRKLYILQFTCIFSGPDIELIFNIYQ